MSKEALMHNPCRDKVVIENGKLPWDDEKFEVVVMIFVLHFYMPLETIKEVTRCMASYGHLVFNIYGKAKEQQESKLMLAGLTKKDEIAIPHYKTHYVEVWTKLKGDV